MENTQYSFNEVEILERIKEVITDHAIDFTDTSEIAQVAFNEDYYIIGTYAAEKALENYGVFDAFETIRKYEMDNFGSVQTDFSNAENVASMLWVVLGENVLYGDDLEYTCILEEAFEDLETDDLQQDAETEKKAISYICNKIDELIYHYESFGK